MPKILIKETDLTSPGTPGSYANYSVLIAGPMLRQATNSDPVLADTNGVYEFTSADDFKNTIGLVSPKVKITGNVTVNGQTKTEDAETYHYGNQMAYELLGLGYPVIYAPYNPTDKDDVAALATEEFWEPFKDKSNYDFRFITHGLLESTADTDDVKALRARRSLVVNSETALYDILRNCIAKDTPSVEDFYAALDDKSVTGETEVSTIAGLKISFGETVLTAALIQQINAEYTKLYQKHEDYPGLHALDAEGALGEAYASFINAVFGVINEKNSLSTLIRNQTVEGSIDTDFINMVNGQIANLAMYNANAVVDGLPGRGDCVALIELDEKAYISGEGKPEERIIEAINSNSKINADNGKFCALTVPSVRYKMTIADEYEDNNKLPGAFHYLACFKQSLGLGFAEWYAAAGYTRGVSSYTIDRTSVKLGEIAINALEPRNKVDNPNKVQPNFACNVIAYFRGSYYLWGNRTAHPLLPAAGGGDLTASSFLNIRQLCSTIKKQLYVSCRRFTFDPNSDTLWINFVNAIRPTLETMKADQGIRDYRIMKVYEANPKKATLKAKIRIIPIEAVEDFDLEIFLEDSFGETTATVAD